MDRQMRHLKLLFMRIVARDFHLLLLTLLVTLKRLSLQDTILSVTIQILKQLTGDYGIKTKNGKEWTSSAMAMIKNSGIPAYGALGNNDNGNEYLNTGFFTNKNWTYFFPVQEILHLW